MPIGLLHERIVCVLFPLWIASVTLDQARHYGRKGLQNKLLDR
jgi:hypothetical protein